MGSDSGRSSPFACAYYFNPRSPYGERLGADDKPKEPETFQPTLPVWGATDLLNAARTCREFQPTLPVWGATGAIIDELAAIKFQPTLPVWGATSRR